MPGTCTECHQRLVEIDNGGQILVGCITCNRWLDHDGNLVQLSVEDSAALHASSGIKRGRRDHADLSAISAHRRRTDLIDYSHGQQLRSAKRGRRAGEP
jgi:hypothetical protein